MISQGLSLQQKSKQIKSDYFINNISILFNYTFLTATIDVNFTYFLLKVFHFLFVELRVNHFAITLVIRIGTFTVVALVIKTFIFRLFFIVVIIHFLVFTVFALLIFFLDANFEISSLNLYITILEILNQNFMLLLIN